MADEIRLKVWLLGLGPIVLVIGGVVWLVAWRGGTPAAQRAPAAAVEPLQAQPPPQPPPSSPLVPVSTAPALPAVMAAAPQPGPSASVAGGLDPEPIPELDEIRTPPGSQGWSRQQKLDYMQKVLDDLTAREHLLEREVADAHRSRDPATEQRKAATLAYLRTQKAGFERMHDVALGVRGDHDHD